MLAAIYSKPVGGNTPMAAVEPPKYGFRASACWYVNTTGVYVGGTEMHEK
jgi:hypothetical protein